MGIGELEINKAQAGWEQSHKFGLDQSSINLLTKELEEL
jgi:hypothetical protein